MKTLASFGPAWPFDNQDITFVLSAAHTIHFWSTAMSSSYTDLSQFEFEELLSSLVIGADSVHNIRAIATAISSRIAIFIASVGVWPGKYAIFSKTHSAGMEKYFLLLVLGLLTSRMMRQWRSNPVVLGLYSSWTVPISFPMAVDLEKSRLSLGPILPWFTFLQARASGKQISRDGSIVPELPMGTCGPILPYAVDHSVVSCFRSGFLGKLASYRFGLRTQTVMA